jgi:hypothetical protein
MSKHFCHSLLGPAQIAIALFLSSAPAMAQFTPEAVEQAPTLDALAALLGAKSAQPSTHLLLEAPEVAASGPVRTRLSSEIPGTTNLVLARGRFQSTSAVQENRPPVPLIRRRVGEIPAGDPKPPVWLGSAPLKAGQPARLDVDFTLDKSQWLTLFAHAQGRWWFVSREIKLAQTKSGTTFKAPAK